MPEIAALTARISIEGAQQAIAGLRDVRDGLEGAAASTQGMGYQQTELAQRISSTVAASVNETTFLRAKESSLAALAARYVEASAELQEWIAKNGVANVQAVERQAALDRMAISIQKEALSLRELQEAGGQSGGLGGMKDAVGGLFGELSGIFNMGGIANLLTGGLGVASIAAVAKSIIDLGNTTADNIAQITNLSQRVGMAGEEFTRFAEAADDASISARGIGVSYQEVGSALETFQNNIGRGQLALDGFNIKGGAAKAAFEALGVSLEDAGGKSRGMTDILMDTADALVRMGEGAERTALAKRLGLYELLPILEKGRDGVREMMGAVDASLVPTAEAEKAAIRLKEAEDNLDDSMRGLKQTIGVELIPALADLADQANYALKGFGYLFDEIKTAHPGVEAFRANMRMLSADLVAYGRSQEDSARSATVWADAYAEGVGRVSAATSALPKNDMGDWAAAWEDSTARVDNRMTYIAAAGEDKLGKLKERVDALFNSLGKPLPEAATPRGKVEMAGQLLSGKTTPDKMGAELLGEAIGAAATSGNWQQLVDIQKQAADGTLNYVAALQQVIALAPKAVDNKLAQNIKDYGEVLKATGLSGSVVSFYADQVRQVQVFVKGTQEGAAEYAKAVAKLEEDKKRLERNTGAVATWNATKSWPADQTPAKMEAERLAIEAQIKKDEETLARAKRVKEGYWATVTEFKPMPDFADGKQGRGLVEHHDKRDNDGLPAEKLNNYYASIKPAMEQAARVNVGDPIKTGIVKGITESSSAISTAMQDAVMPAYGYMRSPEHLAMWNAAGADLSRVIADGARQDSWRIRDAFMQGTTGIREQLIQDVIQRLKDGY